MSKAPFPLAVPVPPSSYEEWTRWYREQAPRVGQKVTLFVVTNEQDKLNGRPVNFYGRGIDQNGDAHDFMQGGPAFGDNAPAPLPPTDLNQVNETLTQLPDDGQRLPPVGRRLVVQVPQGDHSLVRVYDRAYLPEPILKLVRSSGFYEPAWVKDFQATSEWKLGSRYYADDAAFAVSPDGRTLVSTAYNENIKVWDAHTHQLLKEALSPHPQSVTDIRYSPDGRLAVLAGGWGTVTVADTTTWQSVYQITAPPVGNVTPVLSCPQFTPDGRYLLLQRQVSDTTPAHTLTVSPVQIYDTKTWAQVETVPEIPLGALAYTPTTKSTRAVYLSVQGALHLWDSRERRDVAVLDEAPDERILDVAFSPDKSLVAVATRAPHALNQSRTRLRVWKTSNGQFQDALSPFEQWSFSSISGLAWSANSHYVFAASLPSVARQSWGVNVWDVTTSRHCAQLPIGTIPTNALALLADGQLLAYRRDGTMRIWSTPSVLEQIRGFEHSLSHPA